MPHTRGRVKIGPCSWRRSAGQWLEWSAASSAWARVPSASTASAAVVLPLASSLSSFLSLLYIRPPLRRIPRIRALRSASTFALLYDRVGRKNKEIRARVALTPCWTACGLADRFQGPCILFFPSAFPSRTPRCRRRANCILSTSAPPDHFRRHKPPTPRTSQLGWAKGGKLQNNRVQGRARGLSSGWYIPKLVDWEERIRERH